jgi:hypothetical protein
MSSICSRSSLTLGKRLNGKHPRGAESASRDCILDVFCRNRDSVIAIQDRHSTARSKVQPLALEEQGGRTISLPASDYSSSTSSTNLLTLIDPHIM